MQSKLRRQAVLVNKIRLRHRTFNGRPFYAIQVPLQAKSNPKWLSVRCHDWKGDAIDEGDEVAAWLSSFLGQRVRLVKYGGQLCKCYPSILIAQTKQPMQVHVSSSALQALPCHLPACCKCAILALQVQRCSAVALRSCRAYVHAIDCMVTTVQHTERPTPNLTHVLPMHRHNDLQQGDISSRTYKSGYHNCLYMLDQRERVIIHALASQQVCPTEAMTICP